MIRRPALLLLALLLGCDRAPERTVDTRLPEVPPPPESEVVARVNGKPITVSDVERQARAAAVPADKALDQLVRAELLAQAAESRGLTADREVQVRKDQEMVRRYLQTTFETESTPENTISTTLLKKAYDQNSMRLVHPDLRQVDHILFMADKDNPVAAALAEEARQGALKLPKGDSEAAQKAFTEYGEGLRPGAEQRGVQMRIENVVTARTGWTVEPFAAATFALEGPGSISQVVQTKFGYHVIRMQRVIPAENVSFEEATPTLRKGLWPRVRREAFARFLERILIKRHVVQFPDRLQQLQEERPLAKP